MARQARAIRTRENLVNAAGVRLAEKGYSRTTVIDVAAEARVATGTLLFHFSAKHQIAEAILATAEELISGALKQETRTGYTGVARSFMEVAHLFAANPVVRAGFRLSAESAEELGWEPARPQQLLLTHAQELLEQSAEPAGTVEDSVLAGLLVEAFTGACMLSAALTDGQDLPERVSRMLRVLLLHPAGSSLDV